MQLRSPEDRKESKDKGLQFRTRSTTKDTPESKPYIDLINVALEKRFFWDQSSNGNTALHWALLTSQFDKAIMILNAEEAFLKLNPSCPTKMVLINNNETLLPTDIACEIYEKISPELNALLNLKDRLPEFRVKKMKQANEIYDAVEKEFPTDAITFVREKERPRYMFIHYAGALTAVALNIKTSASEGIAANFYRYVQIRKLLPGPHEYKNDFLLRNIIEGIFLKLYPYKTCRETSTALCNALTRAGVKNVAHVTISSKSTDLLHHVVVVNLPADRKLDDPTSWPKHTIVLDMWNHCRYMICDIKGDLKKILNDNLALASQMDKGTKAELIALRRFNGLDAQKCKEILICLNNLKCLLHLELTKRTMTLIEIAASKKYNFDVSKDVPRLISIVENEITLYTKLAQGYQKPPTLIQASTLFMPQSMADSALPSRISDEVKKKSAMVVDQR